MDYLTWNYNYQFSLQEVALLNAHFVVKQDYIDIKTMKK